MALVSTTVAPAANAADPALLDRDIVLSANPSSSAYAEQERSIYLAQGKYSWKFGLDGTTMGARPIELAQGWYAWKCVLQKDFANVYDYFGYCTLKKSGSTSPGAGIDGVINLSTSREYYWWSKLALQ